MPMHGGRLLPLALPGILLCISTVALLIVARASAHAELRRTDPADGAVLTSAPEQVLLEFNEAVRPVPGANRVLDSSGRAVADRVEQDGSGRLVLILLPGALSEDVYTVTWRVISADGHPVGGALVFTIGAARAGSEHLTVLPDKPGASWEAAAAVATAVLFLAALAGAGTVAFSALIHREGGRERQRLRRQAALAGAAGAIAIVPGIAIQAVLVNGGGWDAIFDRRALQTVFESSFGESRLVLGCAALALVASGIAPKPLHWPLAWTGALGVVAGFALTGHPRTEDPAWLVIPAALLHTGMAAFWLGGLASLAWLLAVRMRRGDPLAPLTHRFARVAMVSVALLAAAGTLLAAVVLPGASSLWQSHYGRILLAKVIALAILLGLGAINHWRLMPRLHDPAAGHWLRRTVAAELALLGVVLGLTGWLVTTVPPQAASIRAEEPDVLSQQVGPYHGDISVTSLADGRRRLTLQLHGHEPDGPPPPPAVRFSLSHLDHGSGPILREAHHEGGGRFVLEGVEMSVPGQWEVRVRIRISEFRLAEGRFRVTLR